MPEVPECLERRYKALDELIDELSARRSARNSEANCSRRADNAEIKLMCDFWNILKDDPDCNLKREVQDRMGLNTTSTHSSFGPHKVTCYMADGQDKRGREEDRRNAALNKYKKSCCKHSDSMEKKSCCGSRASSPKIGSDVLPLSKVLCSLKAAASFDKKCNERALDLIATQKELQEQIQHLEHREKEGIDLLKKADCMWLCMEDAYKTKVAESLERQNIIMKELKIAEAEVTKWRKNKKEVEFQLNNVNKCHQEITERINQKKNDIKCMSTEIEDLKKRINNNTKDVDVVKKTLSSKKQASDKAISSLNSEIVKLQKTLADEKRSKSQKEQEGSKYIKEAREELQKICKVLLQKKLENEDLKAEKEALGVEIEMLHQTCNLCQDKCKKKQISINDEILKVEKDIANFKLRCIRCHECVDTADARKYCNDCPRCQEERDCIIEEGHCTEDPTNECVCMSVKQKFMDNVFENMYTVLERQVKTRHGKCLAETVMQCLKKSRNGKIDTDTRKILQEYILCTVKKNLNLTIIGGAIKTRCEMDPETYKQLMLCLKQVKVTRAPKVDKGTVAKKDPCTRWGGHSECNCPGGPKTCVCTHKAPPAAKDPKPCPEDPEDKEENEKRQRNDCPHMENTPCSIDCGKHGLDNLVGTEISPWVLDPCKDKSCPFSKNMRAAQCVLGPERLSDISKDTSILRKPLSQEMRENQMKKPEDIQNHPRDRIIEEVMGRYTEVTPIEKVIYKGKQGKAKKSERRYIEDYYSKIERKKPKHSKSSKDMTYAPVIVKNNKFYSIGTLPKMKTIYVSKTSTDYWSSDETVVDSSENSSNDIKLKSSNGIEFTLKSSNITAKRENETNASNKSVGHSDVLLFGRNVCKDVKEIVKEVIKFDIRAKDLNYSSSVELVTVKSLLKLLVTQNKPNESNVTINEKEVNCDFYSMKNVK